MRLSIQTVKPEIKINTTQGKLNITREKENLNIQNSKSTLSMNTEYSKVRIDQSQCFADAGLKDNTRLSASLTNDRMQDFFRGVSRRSVEGNRLKDIRNSQPKAIPEIAKSHMYGDKKSFEFGQVPNSRPTISFSPGRLDIKYNGGFSKINYQPSILKQSYEKAKVDISLAKEGSINIQWFDEKIWNVGI